MTPDEYQKLAARTDLENYSSVNERLKAIPMLIHAHLGMSSETGEVGDAIKKYSMYGRPLDVLNIKEECGDLLWYVSLALSSIGCSMEECMEQNIEKLRIRYPEKFTEEHAAARLDKIDEGFKERVIIVEEEQEVFPYCGKCQHQPCTCGFMMYP